MHVWTETGYPTNPKRQKTAAFGRTSIHEAKEKLTIGIATSWYLALSRVHPIKLSDRSWWKPDQKRWYPDASSWYSERKKNQNPGVDSNKSRNSSTTVAISYCNLKTLDKIDIRIFNYDFKIFKKRHREHTRLSVDTFLNVCCSKCTANADDAVNVSELIKTVA